MYFQRSREDDCYLVDTFTSIDETTVLLAGSYSENGYATFVDLFLLLFYKLLFRITFGWCRRPVKQIVKTLRPTHPHQ